MANPLRDFLFGTVNPKRGELVEAVVPRRSFDDVVIPLSTKRALDHALLQIQKHDLIFHQWGLAERHGSGLGLAFNFAGPPGTGKTICAEAIAHELDKKLLVVRYSEMESLWAGETGKNVSAVFRSAAEQDAVLFFDEADAIAGKRFSSVTQGYQREANTVVNVLLKELEEFSGVVIFATNLAANFDPAFERRIRTHILFEMPGAPERAKIWKVQLHARKTPLADDVDFDELGEKFAVAGGDIKNAVLKAAQLATAEPGSDADKKIHQRHFIEAMQDVAASKRVMEQTLFDPSGDGSHSSSALAALPGLQGAWSQLAQSHGELEENHGELMLRVGEIERRTNALPGIVERFDDAARAAQASLRADVVAQIESLKTVVDGEANNTRGLRDEVKKLNESHEVLAAQSNGNATSLQELAARLDALQGSLETQRIEARSIAQEMAARVEAKLRFFQIVTISLICLMAATLIYTLARR